MLKCNRTVVNGLNSHIICSIPEVRFKPDARQRRSKVSIGELSLCWGGSLISSSPLKFTGKQRIGTISLLFLGPKQYEQFKPYSKLS